MNHVTLIGRLTADPEIQQSGSGTSIAKYRLAVDRDFKQDGKPEADFFRCVVFGKSAEFVEKYLHKGMKIAVEGRVQTDSYKKEDGSTVYTTDIIVNRHEFCESKKSRGDQGGAYPPEPEPSYAALEGPDEDFPF